MIAVCDNQVLARSPGPVDKFPGVGRVERHGLLHQNMRTGVEGRARLLVMEVVGRRDDNGVGSTCKDVAVVFASKFEVEMTAHALEFARTDPAHAVKLHVRTSREYGDVILGSEPAGPDHGYSHGHGVLRLAAARSRSPPIVLPRISLRSSAVRNSQWLRTISSDCR